MKLKITLLFILAISSLFSQENDFEGIITYKLEVKNPNPELISDSLWNVKVGNSISVHKYYYKSGNYKNLVDGKELQIYNPESNKIYNYSIKKDTIFTNIINAYKSIDSLKNIVKSDEIQFINGYDCNKLVIKSKLAESIYYYSNKVKISAENYINHHYGNWYEYLKETNALPIKIIIKNKFLNLEMNAISVEKKKLSIREFKLPKNTPTNNNGSN
jgi:hypothetical protein